MKAKTVLIVEDDQDQTMLLASLLKRDGYDVISAPDAVFAITTARNERPDLILLDIRLPCIDGLTLLREFRASFGTAQVIVMTGLIDDKMQAEALTAGAYACLVKPVLPKTLMETIEAALKDSSR